MRNLFSGAWPQKRRRGMREQRDEQLVKAETVSCLVALSKAFTRTSGHKVLKHWDQFQAAFQRSLRGVGTIGQWEEKIRVGLRITTLPNSPGNSLCSAMERLEQAIDASGYGFFDWLYLVRKELSWFIIQLRLESERRAEARESEIASP
jgi:hypothetical protein